MEPESRARDPLPHVLVAEDEAHLARLVETLLEAEPVRVTTVSTGPEALEVIRTDPSVRLVLLDLVLPGMGGLEVLRKARAGGADDVPILVVTGKGGTELRDRALALGATDLVTKPFSPRALVDRIRTLCAA
jgi:DNA-binding response OmpR family regulator